MSLTYTYLLSLTPRLTKTPCTLEIQRSTLESQSACLLPQGCHLQILSIGVTRPVLHH